MLKFVDITFTNLSIFCTICNLNVDEIFGNSNYILFTKWHWLGDSEGTFRSSSQTSTCPMPTYLPHTVQASHDRF